jgi:type II secretory pathway pseudopilin PulG
MTRVLRHFYSERGEGLLSSVVAIAILGVGITGLLSLLAATAYSAERSMSRNVATALADARIEVYRDTPYTQIRLQSTAIPTSPNDPYVTAHSRDETIPSSTGQVTGGSGSELACSTPTPSVCTPTQTVTGSDHQSYRVDTYIAYDTVSGGGTVKRVVVVVRSVRGSTVGSIAARAASAFDASSV